MRSVSLVLRMAQMRFSSSCENIFVVVALAAFRKGYNWNVTCGSAMEYLDSSDMSLRGPLTLQATAGPAAICSL